MSYLVDREHYMVSVDRVRYQACPQDVLRFDIIDMTEGDGPTVCSYISRDISSNMAPRSWLSRSLHSLQTADPYVDMSLPLPSSLLIRLISYSFVR